MLILFYDLAQCDKWTLTDSLESPKCLSYKESLDAISEESWVTLSDEKAYWADQGFFFTLLFHIEICSTNLNEKPFISKVQHLSYPVFCTAKNQLVTTNYSLVDWIYCSPKHMMYPRKGLLGNLKFLCSFLSYRNLQYKFEWQESSGEKLVWMLPLSFLLSENIWELKNAFSDKKASCFFTLFFLTFHNQKLITIGMEVNNQV